METSSAARRFATRFVAGETLDQALNVSRRLNTEGITVTLDHLGESVTSLEEAASARDVYVRTLKAIHDSGIQGNVSLKLTQFGLDYSYDECRNNVEQLVRCADSLESFVRVDMESSEYTERTLQLVESLHAKYPRIGTVIQAYLYRSKADVEKLCAAGIRVRLCKGAYLEPATVAFSRKEEVDRSFIDLARLLLDRGDYPAIATHDPNIIQAIRGYAESRGIPKNAFEFQMLYGIRRDLQRQLVDAGHLLRLYVPFGMAWYPYYMRRLAERPANVFFILRNIFRH
jgi:proline dehydrogenase